MSVSVTGVDYDNVDGLAASLDATFKANAENGDQILNLADAAKARAEGRSDGPKKNAPRPAYEFQPFPQHVYHADGRDKVVATPKQLKAAKDEGYREQPYPKVRVALEDPKVEKAALQAKLAESDGKIASQNDLLQRLSDRLAELEKQKQ